MTNTGGKTREEFRVKWKGFPESEASWRSRAEIANCPDKLIEFRLRTQDVRRSKRDRNRVSALTLITPGDRIHAPGRKHHGKLFDRIISLIDIIDGVKYFRVKYVDSEKSDVLSSQTSH